MKEGAEKQAERLARARAFRDALIAHQRKQPRGWQTQLAAATGLREAAISKIVSGDRPATVEQMLRISGGLKAPALLPDGVMALVQKGRWGDPASVSPAMSGPRSTVTPTPIPASLRGFLDARPNLHPAVKWELEQNHDFRTPDYVVKDERFWDQAAAFFAGILGLAGGPYQERGEDSRPAPRPRKG